MIYHFTIPILPLVKKNNRPIWKTKLGRPFIGKSSRLINAEKSTLDYLFIEKIKNNIKKPIEKVERVEMYFYINHKRVIDTTNLAELPQDCLQECGIIINDRILHPIFLDTLYDKVNPRTEIFLFI